MDTCTATAVSQDSNSGTNGYSDAVSFTLTVNSGAPSKVVFTTQPPATGSAGVALTRPVAVEDSQGNIETTGNTGSTDTVTLSYATRPLVAPFNSATTTYTNIAASNGTATFSGIVLNTAGSYTFTATDTTHSITATSTPATTVSPATASTLTLAAATTTPTAGATDNLTITAKDAFGNTASAYTGSRNLTFGGAANSPGGTHPTVTNATGTATNFGTATAITFTNGVASVSGSNNGVMTLSDVQSTSITVTDGSITNGTGLAVTVSGAPQVNPSWAPRRRQPRRGWPITSRSAPRTSSGT